MRQRQQKRQREMRNKTQMKIIKISDIKNFNNNNLTQFSPYDFHGDGVFCVDREWYERQPKHIQDTINNVLDMTCLPFTTWRRVVMPHRGHTTTDLHMLVYDAYLHGYDYQHFAYARPDATLFRLSKQQKQILRTISTRSGEMPVPMPYELVSLCQSMSDVLLRGPMMLRMSSTSGKHSQSVRPMIHTTDVFDALVSNPQFMRYEFSKESKDSYVVLVPWNEKINKRCEFRLFIYDRKLAAASQQYLDTKLPRLSPEEISSAVVALESFDPTVVHYRDYVADVWVDFDAQTCHLIECNPFGAFSSSGAALFNWESDFDLLHGIGTATLRVLA
jgi:hypothetical protein